MSIAAANMMVNDLTGKLKSKVTADVLESIENAVIEIMSNYEINRIIVDDERTDMLLHAYIDAMRVEGKSIKTITRYEYIIRRFLRQVGVTTRNVTQYHIRQYLSEEKNRGVADSTLKGYCWVFSAYFGWLHRDGILSKNPMGNIGTIKVQKKVKEVFSEIDIEKLKAGCDNVRDLAIVCFLKSTGCRVSEVTNLDRKDIDFNNLECVVLGKGNKQRIVYIDPVTGMILQKYLSGRDDDNPALFIGVRHERLLPNGIRIMLKKLGKKAGVEHVHPHKFRRTEITELVNRGMAIEQVKTLAGHEKIDTTMGYVKIDQIGIKQAYRKYA